MEERTFHPLDYVSVLRRRKWWFIVPFTVCILGGALAAWLWPKQYLSEAEIGVAAPALSPELLRGVSSLDKDERQRAVSQQLLSRAVLERVVREENINPGKPVEDSAAWLRSIVEKNITVPQPIGKNTDNTKGLDSFKLGYMDSTPERAQRIANRLAYVFVEENSKTRTEQASNTSEVLGQQVKASQERLASLQEQLRVKKEAFMGRLPDQMNANIQNLNGLRQQLQSISMQLAAEQDRLSMIESQLAAMRQGVPGSGVITSSDASQIQDAQKRIATLQNELAQNRALGFTDKHPEIVRIQTEIAEARKALSAAQNQNSGSANDLLQSDPTYRQKLQERDASRLRVRSLQTAESHARAQIAEYQSRVEAAPKVEQELASLTQAEKLEEANYAELTNKHQAAIMAEDLERKQGGERFSVLYPANLPTTPFSPDMVKLMAMAVALGLVLGGAGVVGREFLDRSVHDAGALQNEFEIPVLGEIPRIAVVHE
jgi:polysaccharide chain length determinant protein (PEP-CTERM system associated)